MEACPSCQSSPVAVTMRATVTFTFLILMGRRGRPFAMAAAVLGRSIAALFNVRRRRVDQKNN